MNDLCLVVAGYIDAIIKWYMIILIKSTLFLKKKKKKNCGDQHTPSKLLNSNQRNRLSDSLAAHPSHHHAPIYIYTKRTKVSPVIELLMLYPARSAHTNDTYASATSSIESIHTHNREQLISHVAKRAHHRFIHADRRRHFHPAAAGPHRQ